MKRFILRIFGHGRNAADLSHRWRLRSLHLDDQQRPFRAGFWITASAMLIGYALLVGFFVIALVAIPIILESIYTLIVNLDFWPKNGDEG